MLSSQFLISFELLKDEIKDFSNYPFSLQIVKFFEKIELHKNVTFLIGENGTGKSTLLESLATAYGFNPEGGSKNHRFRTKQTHSVLSEFIRYTRGVNRPNSEFFLRAESFYNLATNVDEIADKVFLKNNYGGKSLHEQSHGESFMSLFNNRFQEKGFYILDEPEAALSPQRQMSFLIRLNQLVKEHCQFIIATHSPIILSYPNSKIIQISENGLEHVDYEETEHYKLYKFFLNNKDYMMKNLQIEKNR